MLESLQMQVSLYENKVHVSMKVRLPPIGFDGGTGHGLHRLTLTGPLTVELGMVSTPGSDAVILAPATPPVSPTPNWPRLGYLPNGSAQLLLRAAAYYDTTIPSEHVSEINGQFAKRQVEPGQAGAVHGDPGGHRVRSGVGPVRLG